MLQFEMGAELLEKNAKAIAFYERHGFRMTNDRKYEEDTTEVLVRVERKN